MKINKLTPQGYCSGVKNALKIAYEVLSSPNYPRPIYLLGSIIHNQNVISDLKEKGAILIEENGVSRNELIDKISSGTVIFSAHGVSPIVYEKANKKGLTIVDTTCGNVLLVQQQMKKYLSLGYTCLYIGTKGHPECEGILGLSSSIILIESIEDLKNVFATKIYATNQTTLSLFETEQIYQAIKDRFPETVIDNKICKATTIRQQACLNQAPVDLCLVVGDKASSNTKKLALASQSISIPTLLIEGVEDLKNLNFQKIKSVSITSGASTPDYIVNEIINYLKRVEN
ncbi:MAG: 4-hydroxy-3-methylbut-2-enyl diphosphate reductase [Roseburia sp.]|nr:4-hydroxy-3-methylbut-2-enyl diphosphate reductase [Anaeroplasma bactoclasticum]MCM1196755.1 4-hydroxy-3-methylbut-2-enyl diphosphate reductase [Roseburia sp.]MCM1556697.1 4-hydroxy-3-methylbut-2-enyl diphosphate reductase [Anaeroplasma bactoclasticum]